MTSRGALAAAFGIVTLGAAVMTAPASAAVGDCVGGPGCRASLQAAVDAARPGATIRVNAGTYAGGVHIAKSLVLTGSGADRTVIRGGGPVLTIDTTSSAPATVLISGLTVTGGVAHGADRVNAFGGGVFVTAGPGGAIGATVTLRDVVVSDNRTEPTATSPSPSGVKCPDGDCPYAGSRGGGIASFGTLTLERAVVTRNGAVGPASDAAGGGIFTGGGSLTIRSSSITGNRAAPERFGRFAEGGGVNASATPTTIQGSSVSGNSAELVTSWPIRPQGVLLDMALIGGGIHIADGGAATITDTTFAGNRILGDDPAGEVYGFGTAIVVDDGSLVRIARTVVSKNRLEIHAATSEDVGPSGGALEIDAGGALSDVQITDNTAVVSTVSGQAQVYGALGDYADNPQRLVLTRVTIRDNTAVARSRTGSAQGFAGGIVNNALMDLRGVMVKGNSVAAYAPTATVQGGGIYSGPLLVDQQVALTLSGSTVTDNSAMTSAGGTAQGGGVYTVSPVTITDTHISGNRPDQCTGCAP